MILLIGHAGAGKTTIEMELNKLGYDRIVSYTTRKPRENEIEGIDYHFISEKEFKLKKENNLLAESTYYREQFYGIAIEDCLNNKVVTVEPVGFRMLKKIPTLEVVSFYIQVPERIRLIRMAQRGDEIMEIFRRLLSDQGSFNGIEDEVTYIVNNDRPLNETVDEIVNKL
jgi:guanylate kinase